MMARSGICRLGGDDECWRLIDAAATFKSGLLANVTDVVLCGFCGRHVYVFDGSDKYRAGKVAGWLEVGAGVTTEELPAIVQSPHLAPLIKIVYD
jgi:hypothetical protein